VKRLKAPVATAIVGISLLALTATGATAFSPSIVPYGGADPSLSRAPYVTDLTQTSAYVNWATTSRTPGSVQVAPMVNGVCPASVTSWSPSATPVPTSLPGAINPTASAPGNGLTGWQFTASGDTTTQSEFQASVPITGLSASTRYCYAVFSTDLPGAVDLLPPSTDVSLQALTVQSFTTLDPVNAMSTAPLTFDVIGDTGENYAYTSNTTSPGVPDLIYPNGVNPNEASLYQQIGASGAKFLVMAGDISYSGGTESTYGDLHQTGASGHTSEVSNIFGPSYFPQTGGIPTFAADGNHGQTVTSLKVWPTPVTAGSSNGTYAYDSYSDPANGAAGNFPDDWYAFSTGNVRIYVIDAAWADGLLPTAAYQTDAAEHWQTNSPEYQWLQRDLAAYPGGVKLAVFHFPLRSVNATQPSDTLLDSNSPNPPATLESLLSGNGVGIAFNGHAHTYQRFKPTGPGQIASYVTGGGGGVLEPVFGAGCAAPGVGLSDMYALGWSPDPHTPGAGSGSSCGTGVPVPTSAAQVYNFLKVSVSGSDVTVTPINAAGTTFDPQTYSFPTPPQPSTPTDVTATLAPPSTVQLTWAASAPTTGRSISSYQIARNGTPIATVSGAATSFTDTNAPLGTVAYYRVTAVDNTGASSWPGTSNSISTVVIPPAAPVRTNCVHRLPSGSVVGAAALDDGSGYYEVDTKGDVAAFGSAVCYGALTGLPLNQPIVGMATDSYTGGYWLVASDGGIFSFNAPFYGSTGAFRLNKPIVGMTGDPVTGGYWMVASDGGVFSFHAPFYGSTGAFRLNKPMVGMAVDRNTGGYWLVASDGGVFSFHAPFHGSTGNIHLNKPIVGIAATSAGSGYRLVASDGGVFTGHAAFYGSTGGLVLQKPMITMVNDNATDGYWLVASDGGVFSGHAPFFGSAALRSAPLPGRSTPR
jgi:Calcineurin-like phosphoesterase